MTLPELSIRRPVFATVMSLVVLLLGLMSYSRLSVREYPKIDEPVVTVDTTYRGASAEIVESQVTQPLEDSLAGIEGISQVFSVSGEWDLVAMLEVAEHEAIARIVTEEVTVVPGIRSTHTLTAFRAYSKKDLEQAWDIGLE